MHARSKTISAALAALALTAVMPTAAHAQSCGTGVRVEGTVVDPNGNTVVGATVTGGDGENATTDAAGRFTLACLPAGAGTLSVDATGFASATATADSKPGSTAHLTVKLALARVETTVQVGDDPTTIDADHGIGTHTLTGKDIQQLADDPDDFQRQLQILAATSGGAPGQAKITVDGFQNGSALPPKGSIASIRVNPDMFSSEYEDPPYDGGRIEIFTKPGMDSFHGALFFTDSDSSFNATDPLSTVATPAGKRRYGFELSGPIIKKRSDFSLNLEKRDIDEFNVVDAVSLDASGNAAPLHQTVAAPPAALDRLSPRRLAGDPDRRRHAVLLGQRQQLRQPGHRRPHPR